MDGRAMSDKDTSRKRRKILDAAKKIFSQKGYQTTTVSEIAEAAGESTAAFYTCYKSKTEIYRALTVEGIDVFKKRIGKILNKDFETSRAMLSEIVRVYLTFYMEEREYYDIIATRHLGQEDFRNDRELLSLVVRETRGILDILSKLINIGIKSGEFNRVNSKDIALTIWGLLDGLMLLDQRDVFGMTGKNIDTVIQKAVEILYNGLLKKSP